MTHGGDPLSVAKITAVFMGSPEFALPTLDALIGAPDIDLLRVVSQPDRAKGRGRRVAPTPVRARALERGLATIEMSRKNYADVLAELSPLRPDFIVVAAFGLILRGDLLGLPRFGCVNLHPSLLPRHRGVSPVQHAILAGDAETGCTTMLMDEGVDTGDILLVERTAVQANETAGALAARLARLGAPLIVRTLRGLAAGAVTPVAQDESMATYTKMIDKTQGEIDWAGSASDVDRLVRAMNPWPSAYTTFRGRRLIVLESRVAPAEGPSGAAGDMVSVDPPVVACGEGAIELVTVKMEGKREMPAAAFIAGQRVDSGERFG